MRQTKKKILPLVFASGLLTSSLAQAAQLGKLEVLSGAGEPFSAEIRVDSVSPEERASLQARLASADAFKAARLDIDPNLKNLQFAVQNGTDPSTALIKITSAQPLPAGFMDALVELTWAGGRVAREYTLTIPVAKEQSVEPQTSLPEIRPPMTPPAVSAPEAPVTEKSPSAIGSTQDTVRQVKRGDTLSELVVELGLVRNGVTLNQAMAAMYEANKSSFINGSVHLLREGAQIQVPNRTALRVRSSNEALLVLARNDDRNVYSAYARQIGLLTVENQEVASASTSSQGSIAPKDNSAATKAEKTDRLQIAPDNTQRGGANSDARAEELLAKNKALSEANERIALLEKNVSDLQRLLDMQQDLSDTQGAAAGENTPAESIGSEDASTTAEESSTAIEEPPVAAAVDTPAEETTPEPEEVTPPVAEVAAEDVPFNWIPWLLAGAGGLVILVTLLLVARARSKNKNSEDENSGFESDDKVFSEVNQFDEEVAAASAGIAAEREATLNKTENSDFDLDEVLNERLKPAEPEVTEIIVETPIVQVKQEEPVIPDLKEESEDASKQVDSLNSEVKLDFPEDESVPVKENSIFDDLESLEKGAAAAQEELAEIRKQPLPEQESVEQEASDTFDPVDVEPPVAEKLDLDVDVPDPKVDDATWQEVATKLDLAGAYVEIGDADGAKELLSEIVKKGDVEQIRKAKALLATLN